MPHGFHKPRQKTFSSRVAGRNCQVPLPFSVRTPYGVSMWLWM